MEIKPMSISVLDSISPVDGEVVSGLLEKERKDFNRKILVLDDDPTGTQTVHDVPVVTDWEEETIEEIFAMEDPKSDRSHVVL